MKAVTARREKQNNDNHIKRYKFKKKKNNERTQEIKFKRWKRFENI